MTLAILNVIAGPLLEFPATAHNGDPLKAQVFAGECHLGDTPGEKLLAKLTSGGPVRLGFYVPGAGPLRPSWLLSTWGEVSLAKTTISAGDYSHPGPYGADSVEVQLVEDDKGTGGQWPYFCFMAYGDEPMVIRYRLTVTRPAD